MIDTLISDGAAVALINAVSLVVVAYFQYKTKKDVTEVKRDTKDQTAKIEQTNDVVASVHQIANGRLTEALDKIEQLKAENDKLKADSFHRRASDAKE